MPVLNLTIHYLNILSQGFIRRSLILCILMIIGSLSAYAAPSKLTLSELLKNTVNRNAQVQETMADVEAAKSQVELAKSALWPKASATILVAPIFEEKGNALISKSNWNKWGPLVSLGVQVVQPVYTFGMIGSYRKAADKQVEARKSLVDVKQSEVILSTKEFYYSYLMACELESLVDGLIKFLEEAVSTAEKGLDHKNSNVKAHDLYKLKSALEDLRQRKLQAVTGRLTAVKALSWVTATQMEELSKEPLEPEEFEPKDLEYFIQLAHNKRPELHALNDGKEARLALRDAKLKQGLPIVFVGAFAGIPWSSVREKQASAFAYDPYNQIQGGVGVGLKFDLEFMRHQAEAAEQDAELLKLNATKNNAVPGIELQVQKAYWEWEQAKQGLSIADRRKVLGKKWFVSSAMGWSVGLTEAKDLLEALEGQGLSKKNYIETVFAYNMALAHLSQAVGVEVTHLSYR